MASLQQVVEQLVLLAAANTNATIGANATSIASTPQGPFEVLTSLTKMFFSAKALRDWAIILVIGSLFETGRRLLTGWWSWLINSFFFTAVFDEDDASFLWIMHWLSQQPSWKSARNVEISTSNFARPGSRQAIEMYEANDEDDSRKVAFLPAVSETYTIWYKYRWMKITRTIETHRGGWSTKETLTMSILTRNHQILTEILQEAKVHHQKAQADRITIYVSGRNGGGDGWRELATRPKRPLNSIILDPGIADLVLDDARDFLKSKQWYSDRGIPFRRGYLLYGAPGSGKTSLIHSIAGELGLDVYIVSLSRSGLDDTGLAELISDLPERCIALMEDIDAAFHHGLSRESPQPSTPMPDEQSDEQRQNPNAPPASSGNRVSLSGLLNALDGIAAQEGRILFATTNKYSSLDPALCRPGRMDLHIEFKHASRYQAEELFKRFYALSSSELAEDAKMKAQPGKKNESGNGNGSDDSGFEESNDLIDLSSSEPATRPSSSSSTSSASTSAVPEKSDVALGCVGVSHRIRAPRLSASQIATLATQFSSSVPDRQISMASLQGFLMTHKTRPYEAVAKVSAWVEEELKEKEKKAAS